ncbi:MAG: helix-turn-helix transcriptional regulator [Lachnospiraceae bacterium]|nr:helix-turn-helix transcriptional regulator [Lachnospiraceae bacterium]
MPTPIPQGQQIIVTHIRFDKPYHMDSLQMATDHYNIGITLRGHRRTITPLYTYSYQAGDVALLPPYVLHRTLAEYNEPYERIMVKFSPEYVEPFIRQVGQPVFNRLYETYVYHFSKATQEKLKTMFFDIYEEYQKDTPYKEFIMQGMLFRIFTTVLEEHISEEMTLHPQQLSPAILGAIIYMEDHYKEQPSMEKVAEYAGFSAGYFSRLFHAQLGMTYSTYLNNIQLRHVQILLSTTNKSVMEIAQETGYCHGEYLSAMFKKKTGLTPSQYRKQCLLRKDTVYLPQNTETQSP